MHLIEVSSAHKQQSWFFEKLDLAALIEWIKLIVILTSFSLLVVSKITEGGFYNSNLWIPLYGFFSLSLIAHFIFVLNFHVIEKRKLLFAMTAFFDGLLITAALFLYGSAEPVLLLAYLLNIILVGSYLGLWGAVILALVSSAFFNLTISSHIDFLNTALTQLVALYNGSFFISAVVAGVFQAELSRATQTIETQKEDIKSLQDVNQLIVENVGSGLIVTDIKNKIIKSNRAASRILADISLVNKNILDVIPALQKVIPEVQSSESQQKRIEVGHLNYEGTKMVLEVLVTPLVRKPYGFQGLVFLIQNLTEVKNFEEALKQQEKMAAIGSMAAGIAHEIRNPLASISGSVQLIAASLKPESIEDKKLTSIIVKEIDRLNRLIAEFLEFVKPPMKVDERVDINFLLNEIVQMSKANPQVSSEIKIETHLKAQSFISGHYDKLKQAFLNILINASHAVEKQKGPHIFITTTDVGDEVQVEIKDNGIGMSRDTQARIFVPFFTTKSKGTGLGLAITHKIFEAHEARVRVESALNEGTTFFIVFKRRGET